MRTSDSNRIINGPIAMPLDKAIELGINIKKLNLVKRISIEAKYDINDTYYVKEGLQLGIKENSNFVLYQIGEEKNKKVLVYDFYRF